MAKFFRQIADFFLTKWMKNPTGPGNSCVVRTGVGVQDGRNCKQIMSLIQAMNNNFSNHLFWTKKQKNIFKPDTHP